MGFIPFCLASISVFIWGEAQVHRQGEEKSKTLFVLGDQTK